MAVGVAAATISATGSGPEIRAEFERIRSDIERRDFDALGAHLEERFKDLQASLEERFSQAGEAAKDTAAEAAADLDDTADVVEEAVEETVE